MAWLYSQHLLGGLFSAKDLLAMATRDAAAILKWHKVLGSIEPGKRADLVVIAGKTGDPYEAFIKAKETSIRLVMINGIARYGMPALMTALRAKGEAIRVGGKTRHIFLEQASGDPDVGSVSLKAARETLRSAFQDLPRLALELEKPKPRQATRALDAPQPVVWSLALDEIQSTGVDQRPRLPFAGPRDFTGPDLQAARAAVLLSSLLQPIELDPLTVADDSNFLAEIAKQPNLPEAVRTGLAKLY